MIRNVVFDIGGVLVDWNPQHLYRKLIADAAERERFLAEICPQSWNEEQDAGRPLAAGTAAQVARFPQHADLISAYYGRWEEMLAGPVPGTPDLLLRLHARQTPLYALTNWPAELFPIGRRRFPFLKLFRGIVVSGEEGVIKPDPAIFAILGERHALRAEECLFIDDNPANVAAAAALGFAAHRFTDAASLERWLTELGLLD
ncbi:MAG: HAD family phosphatase [Rhodocyclales bacterium]|nr:HAD family phosphatase [Rhodocyclales bacterium]